MWEQRLSTLMQTLAVAILLWIGTSTVSTREEIVSLKLQVSDAAAKLERLQVMQQQVRELEYTQKETLRRLAELETRTNGRR